MSELHVRRIRKVLLQEYSDLIDLADVQSRPSTEVEQHLLTRSQAAMALSHIADIPATDAAAAVVDGFDDNGLDAIYFDEDARVLFVVQSKWVSQGTKSVELGAVEKFVRGVRDLLVANFDKFNQKVNSMRYMIEAALDSHDVFITLVIAYTGTQPLSVHAERVLGEFLEEINDATDVLSYRVYSQKELYNAIAGGIEGTPINLDVTVHDWGSIVEPFRAYYGRVSATEIAEWYADHDSRLFVRNLRKFKGDTEVNRQIKSTLISEPEKFWYFNNGITVLCNRITKKPRGASNRDTGHFHCEGISVVNGAQTVGNIAASVQQGFRRAQHAYVLVRFISLEDCPPDFAREVTTATNTQNRIEPRDFASLDATQERLRKDLSLDLDMTYVYKSGEPPPLAEEGCTIEEATIALACANPDIQLTANAKSALGKLWEDIKKPPYTLIFNEQLTAARMWHCVAVLRTVDRVLEGEKKSSDGIQRRVAIHGNRFVLHRVFHSLPLHSFDNTELDMEPVKRQATEETVRILEETVEAVKEHFSDAYLNSFFKSGRKCAELSRCLPELPALVQTPYLQTASKIEQRSLFSDLAENSS